MNILIVEDDAFKARQIEAIVRSTIPQAFITLSSSLSEAMNNVLEITYSHVLLDMAIPSHPSEDGSSDIYSQPVGGLDVLLYLALEQRSERVMVLTQYPTIEFNREHVPLSKLAQYLENDGITNLTAIALFGEDGGWERKLSEFLKGAV